ncbi:peptidoglycan-binding protein [Candidatus Thiodictyon syntrophicum]|uniref:peptidoglycan-binding protein n=1 Tax=Candidatus Thiodictyon syntrophicum TaxID=1166950 RepID=UPI0012FDF4C6|nr:peptidoglycan-binding protein [Candidatus Thiodictyon syntrophicum]
MAKTLNALCWSRNGCRTREIVFPSSNKPITLSGKVGLNGDNLKTDVSTIQSALNDLPPGRGGPAVPLKVDGICGPKTRAAIYGFQFHHGLVADSRIDPGKATLLKINEIRSRLPAVHTNDEAIVRVYGALGQAASWTWAAQRHLREARDYLTQPKASAGFSVRAAGYERVNTYFKLSQLGNAGPQVDAIDRLNSTYLTMRTVIGHHSPLTMVGSGIFQVDPTTNNKQDGPYSAFTFSGGWTRRDIRTGLPKHSQADGYEGGDFREDTIFIATNMVTNWLDINIATLVIHELAHFVGPELGRAGEIGADIAYSNTANFKTLTHWQAMRNADSYAIFANHAGLGHPHWYVGKV